MENSRSASDINIDSEEEFYGILEEMYCVEDCFEGMHYWIGKIISDERYDEVLTKLADDSEDHKKKLGELISRIEGLEPEEKDRDRFEFEEGDDDEEVLKKILENDYSALYHYTLLKTQVDEDLLKEILGEEDVPWFHEILDDLIKSELEHINILKAELD